MSVNILTVILYYSFARSYHWGKLSKGHVLSLCIISYNSMSCYSYLKIESSIKK